MRHYYRKFYFISVMLEWHCLFWFSTYVQMIIQLIYLAANMFLHHISEYLMQEKQLLTLSICYKLWICTFSKMIDIFLIFILESRPSRPATCKERPWLLGKRRKEKGGGRGVGRVTNVGNQVQTQFRWVVRPMVETVSKTIQHPWRLTFPSQTTEC